MAFEGIWKRIDFIYKDAYGMFYSDTADFPAIGLAKYATDNGISVDVSYEECEPCPCCGQGQDQ